MPAVLDPRLTARRRRLTEAAQRELNEWYRLNGRQPWEYEHPGGVTPTTLTEKR
jgi:hypothetical protein